ncbi:unnamed protein product, partial [Hapterophycus canaliculatus]
LNPVSAIVDEVAFEAKLLWGRVTRARESKSTSEPSPRLGPSTVHEETSLGGGPGVSVVEGELGKSRGGGDIEGLAVSSVLSLRCPIRIREENIRIAVVVAPPRAKEGNGEDLARLEPGNTAVLLPRDDSVCVFGFPS